jgi:tRNA pseudouridine55 synthase
LVIDKPIDASSSDVVTKLKWAFLRSGAAGKPFRIGHGGTLDPFATGVLVVLFGEGTKLADCYLHSKKTYTGTIRLGVETDSGDLTGTETSRSPIPALSLSDWQALAQEFVTGPYLQIPPMHSAKKRDGVALYELARKGEVIEREAILKKIESFTLSAPPDSRTPLGELAFEVACESGTYVRVIASDLAKKAGTLGHLTVLRRTASSDRRIEECASLSETVSAIESGSPVSALPNFVSLDRIASHVPSIGASEAEARAIRQGLLRVIEDLKLRATRAELSGRYAMVRGTHGPVALLERAAAGDEYRLQRVFL